MHVRDYIVARDKVCSNPLIHLVVVPKQRELAQGELRKGGSSGCGHDAKRMCEEDVSDVSFSAAPQIVSDIVRKMFFAKLARASLAKPLCHPLIPLASLRA